MTTLLLKFEIRPEESYSDPSVYHGPVFHRWLPNGEHDAITLSTGDPNAVLRVWFERRGFVGFSGGIEYDHDRQEVDPVIMATQGLLQAGPLVGQLVLAGLSDEEVASLRVQATDQQLLSSGEEADYYKALGKRVVRLIQRPVNRFLEILRVNYGQYWLRPLEPWDARKISLGAYCRLPLNLNWSLDEGSTWAPFVPTSPAAYFTVQPLSGRGFREYLAQEDWPLLASAVKAGYEPSLAATVLSRAHQLSAQGALQYALLEAVTAFELALDEYLASKLAGSASLTQAIQAFKGQRSLSEKVKLGVIGLHLPGITMQDLELAVKAIDLRNEVAHEGRIPPGEARELLAGLLRVVAAMLPGPPFRFPAVAFTNEWRSVEDWEQEEA